MLMSFDFTCVELPHSKLYIDIFMLVENVIWLFATRSKFGFNMCQAYMAWWICISWSSSNSYHNHYRYILLPKTPLSWAQTAPPKTTELPPVITFIYILTCMNILVPEPSHIYDKLDMKEDTSLLCWWSLPHPCNESCRPQSFHRFSAPPFSFNLCDWNLLSSSLTQHNHHFPLRVKNSNIGFRPLPPPSALADAFS